LARKHMIIQYKSREGMPNLNPFPAVSFDRNFVSRATPILCNTEIQKHAGTWMDLAHIKLSDGTK
jgi:hypothetical protein